LSLPVLRCSVPIRVPIFTFDPFLEFRGSQKIPCPPAPVRRAVGTKPAQPERLGVVRPMDRARQQGRRPVAG